MKQEQRDAEFIEYVAAARPRLRRLAFGICGDWHTADDIVQTTLAKLYVVWPKVRASSNEDAYVRRALVRTSIDESRRPWRRERTSIAGRDQPAPTPDPDARRDLIVALQSIPEMQRKTLVLRHWLGLSVAETAADLGISEGTVKSHTSRALARMQELMTAQEHPS